MATQLTLNGLIAGAIFALIAVGFSMVHLSRRFFDFSLAGSMVLTVYISFRISDALDLGLPAVVLLAILLAGVLNFLLGFFVYCPLRAAGGRPTVMLVASLGLMVVLVNVTSLVFGDAPYRPSVFGLQGNVQVFGGRVTRLHILTFAASLVVGGLTCFLIRWSSFGAQLRAIASDETLSRAMGLRLSRVEVLGGWIGLALATFGVIFSGMDFGLTPSVGFQLLIPAVTACILGGVFSVKGAFVAAFLVGLLAQASATVLGVVWQDTILFLLLIAILLVKPTGFWGLPIISRRT